MFANLKLRQRILLGYLVPMLLLLATMGLVFADLQDAARASERLAHYRSIAEGAQDVLVSTIRMQRAARGYLLEKNPTSLRNFEESEKAFRNVEALAQRVQDPQLASIVRRLEEVGSELAEHDRRLVDLVDAGKTDEALAQFRSSANLKRAREADLLSKRFLDGEEKLRDEQQKIYDEAIAAVGYSMLFGTLTSIVLAIGIAWWFATALSRKISAYAVQLASAAGEIAATVTEHERTASQQAAAANQTSATIEELSASSRQSAEQAANAATLAGDASRSTEEGSATTRQTITAMTALRDKVNLMADQTLRLSEQSGQIGSIAGLVKDLAGEINMLALNAAVEASRAGEHGKGFAVVASEVRKLADQSKKSAEQAAGLIAEIQKATNSSILITEEGARMVADVTRQAEQMGDLFSQLADVVAQVNMNAQQVMLNAKQQAAAFGQVVEATGSISAGTRETAAGISQTKSAIEQLNLAAQNLKAMA